MDGLAGSVYICLRVLFFLTNGKGPFFVVVFLRVFHFI